MLELKINRFEGKNKEDLINQALNELNASKDEVYFDVKEQIAGSIFKTKKYILCVVLKENLIEYTKQYIKTISELMNISCELEIIKRENSIMINIITDNAKILIGKSGRTISSIEALLKQSINSKINTKINVIIDVNNYKEKIHRKIERLAVKLAKEVRKTKVEVKMDKMNSFERRLVHNAVSKIDGVKTQSEGEEPNRYVVIKPIEK